MHYLEGSIGYISQKVSTKYIKMLWIYCSKYKPPCSKGFAEELNLESKTTHEIELTFEKINFWSFGTSLFTIEMFTIKKKGAKPLLFYGACTDWPLDSSISRNRSRLSQATAAQKK